MVAAIVQFFHILFGGRAFGLEEVEIISLRSHTCPLGVEALSLSVRTLCLLFGGNFAYVATLGFEFSMVHFVSLGH